VADDEGARIRVRHRYQGIQPPDVDELEPGGDETDEDRGVMKRQGRKSGGHAKGEHSKSRADKPRRGHRMQAGGLPAGGVSAGVPMGAAPAGAAAPGMQQQLTPQQIQAIQQLRARQVQAAQMQGGAQPAAAAVPPTMASGGRPEKWIQKTGVDKPGHKGRLHRALHVPEGQPIPAGKLAKALNSSDSHLQHMAQFAKNVKR
jgi:hypothetical protein